MMDRMELSKEMTRLRREDQYLVTLKMRSKRSARRTERPKEPAWATEKKALNMGTLSKKNKNSEIT